jgi:hypothetical protein
MQQWEAIMPVHSKSHGELSPLAVLTELAVEGTSSLVETQRALFTLAQKENDIILNGVKQRIGSFAPAVAMTDLVRRSLDTLLDMQQELLTTTSRQTLQWLQSEQGSKEKNATHLVEFAREGVEAFTTAQKKLLDVLAQETGRATSPHKEPESKPPADLAKLAREAGDAFIEAQKRLLDVMGQQMNVNLDAAVRAMDMMSPSRLAPVADRTGAGVRDFLNNETSLIGSFMKADKVTGHKKPKRAHRAHRREVVIA